MNADQEFSDDKSDMSSWSDSLAGTGPPRLYVWDLYDASGRALSPRGVSDVEAQALAAAGRELSAAVPGSQAVVRAVWPDVSGVGDYRPASGRVRRAVLDDESGVVVWRTDFEALRRVRDGLASLATGDREGR